ncbi:hypothetical protein LPJ55_000583 [Coemansia sp. RSA 990]|nr:hypothetical protein LPJ55_000583 [Coemansia sp. RSA 990]
MPQTDNLFLAITLTDEDLIHAMDIASILAKCALHVLVKFEICSTSLVEFPNVSFHALTHLYIPGKIEMQQVVNALRCLPNLIEFEFKVRVKWQSFVKQGLDESVTLSSPVRSLAMHCSEYLVDCMDTAIKFIKYLLLRLPRLEVVVSNGIPRNEIMEFVELNQAAYSHLTSIKFSLAD